jgi:hypothetical protein
MVLSCGRSCGCVYAVNFDFVEKSEQMSPMLPQLWLQTTLLNYDNEIKMTAKIAFTK